MHVMVTNDNMHSVIFAMVFVYLLFSRDLNVYNISPNDLIFMFACFGMLAHIATYCVYTQVLCTYCICFSLVFSETRI